MASFKMSFSIKAKSTKPKVSNKYENIETKCEGIICIDDNGIYKVNYKGTLYSLTSESYYTKNKRVIYARFLDKYKHRIKIIRDKDTRSATNIKFYCAIAPGLMAKGRLVKTSFTPILFHVVTCYNMSDMEGMARSFREWRQYEDKVKNKELDINNEL